MLPEVVAILPNDEVDAVLSDLPRMTWTLPLGGPMRLALFSLLMITLAVGCGKDSDTPLQISELCTKVGERYAASEECNGTAEQMAELCEQSRSEEIEDCLDLEDALLRCQVDASDVTFDCDIDGDEYSYGVYSAGDSTCDAEWDAAFGCGAD